MKIRSIRFALLILLIAVCAITCFGCKKKNVLVDSGQENVVDDPDNEPEISGNFIVKPSQNNGNTETKLVSYNYYTLNSAKSDVVTARSMISADTVLTPEIIMDNFIDSLEDESIILAINEVTVSEKDANFYLVDFKSSIRDIASDSEEIEELILVAAAQSLIDNIDQCSKVGFLIDGKAYSTANRSFDADYIFMDE